MKGREDIYINGQRIPVRFNGWVRSLLDANNQGVSRPTVEAICKFFQCTESEVIQRLDEHCQQHDVSRSWMIEFLVAHRLS